LFAHPSTSLPVLFSNGSVIYLRGVNQNYLKRRHPFGTLPNRVQRTRDKVGGRTSAFNDLTYSFIVKNQDWIDPELSTDGLFKLVSVSVSELDTSGFIYFFPLRNFATAVIYSTSIKF
jgi:hypothetical protein